MSAQPTAAAAGTIDVGGDLTVNRLGFGAMRITGSGVWGGAHLPRPRRHIPSALAGPQPLDNLDQPQQPLTADYRTLIRSLTTHRCTLPSNSRFPSGP